MDAPQLITTRQLADMLAVSPASIKQARHKGRHFPGIHPIYLGRTVRYSMADVIKAISAAQFCE